MLAIILIALIRGGHLVQNVPAERGEHVRLRDILDRPFLRIVSQFINGRVLLVLWELRYEGLLFAAVAEQLSVYVYVMAGVNIAVAFAQIPICLFDAFDSNDIKRQSWTARTHSS